MHAYFCILESSLLSFSSTEPSQRKANYFSFYPKSREGASPKTTNRVLTMFLRAGTRRLWIGVLLLLENLKAERNLAGCSKRRGKESLLLEQLSSTYLGIWGKGWVRVPPGPETALRWINYGTGSTQIQMNQVDLYEEAGNDSWFSITKGRDVCLTRGEFQLKSFQLGIGNLWGAPFTHLKEKAVLHP